MKQDEAERDRLIAVARQVMEAAGHCALVTLDRDGYPQARAMDPFPPNDDLTVWMATNRSTRKVEEIRRDPRATLYYFDREGGGYVTLIGEARLIDDPDARATLWKDAWRGFYDDENRGADYLLIEFVPSRVEIVSLAHEVAADPKAWRPAILQLRQAPLGPAR